MNTKREFTSYEDFRDNFKLEVPDNFNFVYDFLDVTAEKRGSDIAMIHVDDKGVRRDFDFNWFRAESSRLAHALKARGIKKGHKVMLILFRRVEFWVASLALQRLGAVVIPAPAQLTPKDIAFRVEYGKIDGLIVEGSITPRVEDARKQCRLPSLLLEVPTSEFSQIAGWENYFDVIRNQPDSFPRPLSPEENSGGFDPMIVFFSSGTSGMPKMVCHDARYPLGHYLTAAYWHDLEPGDIHFTLADTGWGKAVWGKFHGQWMAGATVFVWDFRGKFEPARLLEALSEHKVTSFCAPPTVYRFIIREDLNKYDLSALRHSTTAGELLNESVFLEWQEKTGKPIYEAFGQTETVCVLLTVKCMKPKPGSVGRPAPGWDVVLIDENGNECPPGMEGEICVRLDPSHPEKRPVGLLREYLYDPERTAEALTPSLYHTGDKAWMDEDGYYWFLGRVDDLIKSSGYRIGPFEVESALVSHEAVVEAAVTGVPDPVRGQAVKASVVLADGFTPSEELTKALQDHVKKVTAPYKYPRIIEYVKELPKTISGKIRRVEIREKDAAKNS
ncbi:MAG: AMP-binding protein [Desulfovibrionaceae bacterium]|nr:AMP-binding protein [Desulfovibrionaceae bacterium]